jgi:hypothetical protein
LPCDAEKFRNSKARLKPYLTVATKYSAYGSKMLGLQAPESFHVIPDDVVNIAMQSGLIHGFQIRRVHTEGDEPSGHFLHSLIHKDTYDVCPAQHGCLPGADALATCRMVA